MPAFIGFDTSTKANHYALCKSGGVLQVGQLYHSRHLRALKEEHDIRSAAIEETPFCKNMRTAIKLAEAVGRMQQQLIDAEIPYEMISVSKWKMLAVGNGRATKEQVKAAIIAREGLADTHEQDCYDAAGVAIAGYALLKQADILEAK